jgi:hypothetical protein
VACLDHPDCTDPAAAKCDGGTCVPCNDSAQCAGIANAEVCEAGTCVECVLGEEDACTRRRVGSRPEAMALEEIPVVMLDDDLVQHTTTSRDETDIGERSRRQRGQELREDGAHAVVEGGGALLSGSIPRGERAAQRRRRELPAGFGCDAAAPGASSASAAAARPCPP